MGGHMRADIERRRDAENRIGTCPGCWGEFKVQQGEGETWLVVLHGYQRPGHGAIIGRCMGVSLQPVEHSPDGIVAVLEHLRRRLDEVEKARQEGGDITSRALAIRIRFAEAELARWSKRGIRGVDLPGLDEEANTGLPRMPLTPEEMEARLERGLALTESLGALTRREDAERRASSPPVIKVDATIPVPVDRELDALEQAVRASGQGLRARRNGTPGRHEAGARLRERRRDHEIATDRLRLAAMATIRTWLAAAGVDDVAKPSSDIIRGNIRIRTRVEARSHEEADAVARSLVVAEAPEWEATSRGFPVITWRVAAASLDELAATLGVQAAIPDRQKSALRRRKADIPERDDLFSWDGGDASDIARLLHWFDERPQDVPGLWRMPAALEPFATWHRDRLETRVGKAAAARWPADAACDKHGNVVFLDTRSRWQVIPFTELCDHDEREYDMPDGDLKALDDAGVVALDGDGRALTITIESLDSGMERITSYQVLTLEQVLGG